jgi:hypothetical protein
VYDKVYVNLQVNSYHDGLTSDFDRSDTESLLVFDKVVCHSTILASIHSQFGKILKLYNQFTFQRRIRFLYFHQRGLRDDGS